MRRVEQHIIKRSHEFFGAIDDASFAAKNMYNAANYIVRQRFIHEHKSTNLSELYHEAKLTDAYKSLPRKVSNDVLRQVLRDWKSYCEAKKAYDKEPSKFLGHPKLPKYKDKADGRNILVYDQQAISQKRLRDGIIKPSSLDIEIQTKQTDVD